MQSLSVWNFRFGRFGTPFDSVGMGGVGLRGVPRGTPSHFGEFHGFHGALRATSRLKHFGALSVSFWLKHFEIHVWSIFQLDVSIDRLLATMNLVVTMGKSPSLPTLGTNLSHNMKH